MTDPIEDILAPAVVERAMSIYESFSELRHTDIVQARRALTRHVFGLICTGETSGHTLTVAGLTYLKRRLDVENISRRSRHDTELAARHRT